MKKRIVWFVIAAAVIAADQLTKLLTVTRLQLSESFDLIPGVFRFTYIRNEGAAFGMLAGHRWIFLEFSSLAIAGIAVYVMMCPPKNLLTFTALSLVAGGGVGNMIDRVRLGYVVDFIDFCAFPKLWKWIFNVADACVCVGAALLILALAVDSVKDAKKSADRGGGEAS